MRELPIKNIEAYVNRNIVHFHESKLKSLDGMNLKDILSKKNPYLFRAKNITLPQDLIKSFMEAFLSSSEEKLFGDFLEDLAIFVAENTYGGRKSSAQGVDLEFEDKGIVYLISIKSGPNWGNSAQHGRQEEDFKKAVKVLKQSRRTQNVQPVLGICYGKTRTTWPRGYMKVVGQNFWYLISGNKNLYTDIVEPLGYRAREHNDHFLKRRDKQITIFTQKFINEFCEDGIIDWKKIVEFNSGNLDLEL